MSRSTRRRFIVQTGAAGGTLALPGARAAFAAGAAARAAKPLQLLILGGTGFAGSHHVHAAVSRGHQVTVFSRSPSELGLPAQVELLIGDRYKDLKLLENRVWDAVIDLAAFAPLGVRSFAAALDGRVKHYTLISTVAAYAPPAGGGVLTESSPLLGFEGNDDPYALTWLRNGNEYGSLKVLCEREAERQFPGRTLILRPGYIAGPGEAQGQFAYWTLRMQKGGEALAAGDPSTPVQFVDVRDMAAWCIRMVEQHATGIYNVTGPAAPSSLGEFIDAARPVAGSTKVTWVPASWLAAREDRAVWSKLLYWSLEEGHWGWAMQMNIDRALSSGLEFRPMQVTRMDTVDAYRQQSMEDQTQLLSTIKRKTDESGVETQIMTWPDYLAREKEVLSAWHAQQKEPS